MDAHPALHPTDQTLSSFGLGKLDDSSAEAVNNHLEQCPDCRNRVAAMSADSFLERVRDAQKPAGHSTFGRSRPGATQRGEAKKAPAPPPASTLPPGLADHPDYEIKRELGRGGMGVVYLAHNTLMGRDEVLKVMGRHIMERPGVLERFLREIRAVAKLRHPNIVTAYHATRLGESIVFAMEYVEGYDLAQLVKGQGPMPVAHAYNFAYQAALGLQHAHEEGLVHRDIKPGNLMLSRKGDIATVKVLDFGLAKATREQKVDGALTSEGQAIGTPDFIAPEQILDAPSADIRADIYSLGGTLYYLLTGRPPFEANSLYDMFQAHMSRDADPLNLVRPEVPVELAALVAKMMAKDPARRFQTPGEVAQALAPFFKKGNVAFKGTKPEVSQDGQTAAGRQEPGAVSTPTQRAMDAGSPVVRGKKTTKTGVPEARWESLIEFRETERSVDAAPDFEPTRRPPWKKWPIALAGALFGLIALGVIITIREKNGRETKISVPDDSTVVVEGPPKNVEIKPSGKGREEAGGTRASTKPVRRPEAKIAVQPAADLLKEGTHWKGLLIELDHDGYVPVYTEVLTINKREGTEFKGVYSEVRGDGAFRLKGTVADAKISWAMTEPIVGHFSHEDRVLMAGTVLGDRIDVWVNWKLPNGEHRRFKGFFLQHAENGDVYVDIDDDAKEPKRAFDAANRQDQLAEGTVWYGLASLFLPAGSPRDFPLVIKIKERKGDAFEGTYEFGDGGLVLDMKGTVKEGSIEWTVSGPVEFAGTTFKGVIQGDRIDFDHMWITKGQTAHGKGLYIRDAGTAVP